MKLKPLALAIAIPLLSYTNLSFSSGFAITENSTSSLGNAFAGAAAIANDASSQWFNPATMSLLDEQQVSAAIHIIDSQPNFTNTGSSVNPVLTGGSLPVAQAVLTGDNANADKIAVIPNLYFTKPINDKVTLGVGINAPFGMEVSYNDNWIGRYQGTTSKMKTININPSLSWKVNDKLALGAGLNAQYIDVTLGSAIDSAAACFAIASGAGSAALTAQCATTYAAPGQSNTDTQSEVSGDDISYGFNLGLLYQPDEKTHIGASYRSKINHHLEGDVTFSVDPKLQAILAALPAAANPLRAHDVSATVNLPETFSISASHNINNKLELLGDITWTGWSSFDKLTINNTSGSVVSNTDENWNDTIRVSIGGNYKKNDQLTLRTGVAFDESPVPDAAHRTVRLPGNDRTWLAFGAGYKVNKQLSVDVGYAHLFIKDGNINHTDEKGYTVNGVIDNSVDILSAQLNWKF